MSPKPKTPVETTQNGGESQEVEDERPRPAKRARVAVACTRCKTRKQKCDGNHPSCGNCSNVSIECEYIPPTKAVPYGKYEYVKALESKVAQLETVLMGEGFAEADDGHWQKSLSPQNPKDSGTFAKPIRGHSRNAHSASLTEGLSITVQTPTRFEPGPLTGNSVNLTPRLSSYGNRHAGEDGANAVVGKMFTSMMKCKDIPLSMHEQVQSQLSPKSMSYSSDEKVVDLEGPTLACIVPAIAERLLVGYIKHISTRWPVIHTLEVRSLHARRVELQDIFEISTLSLVYAIGGRFLETTGETGPFWAESHYQTAVKHLDVLLQNHDMVAVQTLLLHAIYCLRSPRRPGAWTHIGLATRICIELGFHRRTPFGSTSKLEIEMRKRLFWSCYCLDRQVSIILGRPFAISDRDIDAELPLDVDEAVTPDFLESCALSPSTAHTTSTSMSCFIHIIRLRRIESRIQQAVYRVDRDRPLPGGVIERFLEELADWKQSIPQDNRPGLDRETSSFDGDTYYLVYYYKALRLLLYPQLSNHNVDTRILLKCAEACGEVCKTYQRLHHETSVGFSLMALYSIFLAGLTLIYCIWISPKDVYTIATNNGLNSCSVVLYVITERWPAARKYRDAFESIKQCVLDMVSEGDQEPRKTLKVVDSRVRGILEEVQNLHPEGKEDFGKMISDMLDEHRSGSMGSSPVAGGIAIGRHAGPLAGMGMSGFQAQSMYGNQFPFQFQGAQGFGAPGEVESQGQTVDLYDGFDMDNFLLNSNLWSTDGGYVP